MSRPARWQPTVALASAAAVVAGCLALAVLIRRPDLVVVAAPLLAAVLAALARPPAVDDAATVELVVPSGSVWEDDIARAIVTVRTTSRVDLARLAAVHDPHLRIENGGALRCVRPTPDRPAQLTLCVRALHWGRSLLGPATVTFTAGHGLLRRRDIASRTGIITTVPLRSVFDATDVVPQAAGLVGGHRSRRPGSGTDLLAIRPFAPGDRLRRITWPVSLRTGQLHVTTTTDDRDTDVQLVVDTGVDIGSSVGGAPSSLDVAVRASAAVAEHYLRQGDRVGLIDLGATMRPVRPAAGRRHMLLILDVLLGASVRQADHDRITRLLRDVPPRALVIVFSTLLDDMIGRQVATLARTGHTVLVIDTLAADPMPAKPGEWTALATQLAMLRRDTLRQSLVELGVPVVAWRGARSLDAVLLGLAKAATASRRIR